MELLNGFKVVTVVDDRYFSARHWAPNSMREYYTDKFTTRAKGCGPLTVFDSIESVKSALDSGSVHFTTTAQQLFSCEFTPYKRKTDILWYVFLNERIESTMPSLPSGTLLAHTVRLIKRIKLPGYFTKSVNRSDIDEIRHLFNI